MARMKSCHKLFLQAFMSRGILEAKLIKQLLKTVCIKYKEVYPETEGERKALLLDFVRTINENIKPFHMEIKKGVSEEDGVSYYCLVNTMQSAYCKLANEYSPSELEFYKKLIDIIINSDDGQIRSIDALNLTSTLKEKRMSKDEAQGLLKRLENSKWITMTSGKISLSTRTLLELEMYILETYKDEVERCNMCKRICVKGDTCSNPTCGAKLHFHCANRIFQNIEFAKCPREGCGHPWPHKEDDIQSSAQSTSRKRKDYSK